MNLSKIDLPEAVATLLARGEPLTAAQLAAATGKSQPSISLALGKLGERVHRMGAARNTRYALKKDILGLPAQHQLIWGGSESSTMAFEWGQITYLHGNWLHIRNGQREWLTQGKLPWFLLPLRPQGFLGRALARANPGLPGDPEQWSLAHILSSAIAHVRDPSGAFSFVHSELGSWNAANTAEDIGAYYDALAQQIGAGLPVGSSAAGEQPKFLAHNSKVGDCIVKFTPPRGTPFGERWHALLSLEKLALDILQTHGIASARSELIQTIQRSYLQSARFDRGVQGAQHVVAIAAIHDEFVGGPWQNWLHTSETLAKKGLITQQELQHIARIFAFGHYIGNTDMHSGNLSFFVDDVIAPKIRLAPVYDMLPMMWRPDIHQGSLSDGPVRQQFMAPGFEQEKAEARAWAIEFWGQAQQLDIGADLQAAAKESARRLATNFAES
jgi:hypothetical protein